MPGRERMDCPHVRIRNNVIVRTGGLEKRGPEKPVEARKPSSLTWETSGAEPV